MKYFPIHEDYCKSQTWLIELRAIRRMLLHKHLDAHVFGTVVDQISLDQDRKGNSSKEAM